ncbi:serine/threonine-protein kinase [Archangium sp.]|uniref:serine/threonine-protein kinase n=1 Tax=Archangium sp. TaxID=1872627 RepID=UPI00286D1AD0|nr:serine/threonine-protein kinase [Archangium sp.]
MNPHDTPPLPPGTRIGGDLVEGVLGMGSFATVYRVRSPGGHASAVKLVPLEEDGEGAERAWREVDLGARLHHPNLVCQVGVGQWPEDNPRFLWVKLRLIEGPTLERWGQEPGRTVGEVVERTLEVARGLAVAHDARVVHRDVKEDNILVDERSGQAVLVDFGAGYREGDPTLTKGVFPKGAHHYRAPETWAFLRQRAGGEGAHFRAGPAGDLYALGVVLYRLLTGRFPFRLTDEGGVDVEAVLHQAPLSPRLVNPRVPREVDAVCLRLLAKKPEERYPSAVALYEALEEASARADATWHVPLHGSTPPAASKPRRRGARVLVGLGMGLALALGCWWLTSRQEVAPPEPAPDSAGAVAASPAVSRKEHDFMKQQQTSAPQPQAPSFDLEALLRKLCLGLGGSALQACMAAHPQVPPERPAPPPQACPAGAVEAMNALGLRLGETGIVEWSDVRGRAIPVREDSPVFVFGAWETSTEEVALPTRTRLSGRLYFGERRVYGRFTEARTPTGATYPVCMELFDLGEVGLKLSASSEPGKPMVVPSTRVRVVDRFQQTVSK